jgi:hypothetical protein
MTDAEKARNKAKARLGLQELSVQKVIKEQWIGVDDVMERIEAALDAGLTIEEIEAIPTELFPGYVNTGDNLKGLATYASNVRKFANGEL